MMWFLITVVLLVGLGVFAYHYPDLFKKTVDDTTNVAKQKIDEVTKK